MKLFRSLTNSTPFFIFFLTLLAYAPLLPLTGFYWDDWGFAWTARFLGPLEFMESFRPFRPFLGPIFLITTSLLPEEPFTWQVFGLLIRFLSGLAAWWAFKTIWPQRRRQALTVSLFFLVFPAYTQQWSAFTHTNQELIPLIFYLLSFGFTARALRSQNHQDTKIRRIALKTSRFGAFVVRFFSANAYWPSTALALLSGAFGLVTTEYFIGFEVFRLGILWSLMPDVPVRRRIGQTLKHFVPYFLLWLANAAWLAYYYTYGAYNSYGVSTFAGLRSAPASFLAHTAADMWRSLLIAGGQAWTETLRIFSQPPASPVSWLVWGLALIAIACAGFWLSRQATAPDDRRWAWWAVLFGVLGILAGRVPSWAASLPLKLTFSWDRFFLSMMLGSSLLLAGLLELLPLGRRRWMALSLLLALAVGQQTLHANAYRRDWARQQELYWQMAWRMPALEPGTALLTHEFPDFDYNTDLTFTFPVNWMYAPAYTSGDLPYVFLYSAVRLGKTALPALEPDIPLEIPLRTVTFHGSTSDLVLLYFPEAGCLRVLDPAYDSADTLPRVHPDLLRAIPLSDVSRIHVGSRPLIPQRAVFGPEPEHGWCYYYNQAELARQSGDWEQVAGLGDEALSRGLQPRDVYEWLPFIEAFARTGDQPAAEHLALRALHDLPQVRNGLCSIWQRVGLIPLEMKCD